MTGFQGANPQDLRNLAGVFTRATGVAGQAADRLARLTRSDWRISGPTGEDLRTSLRTLCNGLSSCVERVGSIAVDLREQAEQQIRASQADGTASHTAPPAPVLTPLVFRPDQDQPQLVQLADQVRSATHRSLSCMEGNCLPGFGEWMTDREFNGLLPPAVRALEERVIGQLYPTPVAGGVTDLASMQAHSHYHAYVNVTVIPNRGLDLDRLWEEYKRSPAPSATGPHGQPVRSGDSTYDVFWAGAVNPDNPVSTPWPGGWVTHLVDDENKILANITTPLHGLYPGYVIRWIDRVEGPDGQPIYRSWTIGRGTGLLGDTNMFVGSRLFDELDRNIAERSATPK